MSKNPRQKRLIITIIIALVLTPGIAIATLILLQHLKSQSAELCSEITEENAEICGGSTSESAPEPEPEPQLPSLIDLQPTVDAWAKSIGNTIAGVYVYDLDHEAVVASYNADRVFNTESLYKLFVVYEGYRRVERGTINPGSTISVAVAGLNVWI